MQRPPELPEPVLQDRVVVPPDVVSQPLSPDVIKSVAKREQQELVGDPDWKDGFVKAIPQRPLFVQGGKAKRNQYYVVEFRRGRRTTGLMLVNAFKGTVDEVASIVPRAESPRRGRRRARRRPDQMFKFYKRKDIPKLLNRRTVVMSRGRRIKLNADKLSVREALFWTPSPQSTDPFLPFWVVEHKDGDARDRLFVRVDGEISSEITKGGKG